MFKIEQWNNEINELKREIVILELILLKLKEDNYLRKSMTARKAIALRNKLAVLHVIVLTMWTAIVSHAAIK